MKAKEVNENKAKSLEEMIEDYEPTEVEQLSDDICFIIADIAANKFNEITNGLCQKRINVLARGLDRRRPVEAVALLKMFFLISGDKCMADAMDIIDVCAEYDESAYDIFIDSFADTDIMDWHLVDTWLEDTYGDEYTPIEMPDFGGN